MVTDMAVIFAAELMNELVPEREFVDLRRVLASSEACSLRGFGRVIVIVVPFVSLACGRGGTPRSSGFRGTYFGFRSSKVQFSDGESPLADYFVDQAGKEIVDEDCLRLQNVSARYLVETKEALQDLVDVAMQNLDLEALVLRLSDDDPSSANDFVHRGRKEIVDEDHPCL
ncbi:uncharacterized protein G2W53_001407 [Senna tora]|uniref:Uncharacterized protein n=1 Tax=Senna tora TaxID=362788 RepID=A0A835CMJ0_9FABA|nr:uncharacterized protein G2W53_001407 [Senna tora]